MDQRAGLSGEARKLALESVSSATTHLEDNRLLKLVAAPAGIQFRTAQRWGRTVDKARLGGTRAERASGERRARAVSVKIKEAIEGLRASFLLAEAW